MGVALTEVDRQTDTADRDQPVVLDQGEVIAWLATPAAHGPGVDSVEQIDTHTAVIFLVGSRAYKLKRAVRYDYLDYSTAARRRECCIEEVRLNRRTAPNLYRGVRAVTLAPDGSLALDGWGRAVDWLVDMARFDQEAQLDRLAARQALDLRIMAPLADAIVRLHDVAEWRFDHGGRDGMAWVIRSNHDDFHKYGRDVFDTTDCARVTTDSFEMLDRHAPLLEARQRSGFVRHCHGDLHLRNVCVVDGAPTLFDCVEFNPTIACVDVMYDLAFLLMDLLHRGLDRHANVVLNRYVERTDDLGGLALLPLFLSARAAVRAKTSATASGVQHRAREATRLRRDARQYLALAQTLLAPQAAQLVAVGGPSGSGKTTLAARLAPTVGPVPGALVLRSDIERKRLLGVSPTTRLGAEGYTRSMSRSVYRTLTARAARILKDGHGVIVDAVCGHPLERAMLADVARANHVPFTGLWLEAPLATLTERLHDRVGDASDATPRVAARQLDRGSAPAAWVHIDAAGDQESVWRQTRRALDASTPR
jgi:aminoglycoside phosphotransferase family enzyme